MRLPRLGGLALDDRVIVGNGLHGAFLWHAATGHWLGQITSAPHGGWDAQSLPRKSGEFRCKVGGRRPFGSNASASRRDHGIVTLSRETIGMVINARVSSTGLIRRALLLSARGACRKLLGRTAVCEITALLVACQSANSLSASTPSQSKIPVSATLSPVKVPTPTTTADVPDAVEQEPSPDTASSFRASVAQIACLDPTTDVAGQKWTRARESRQKMSTILKSWPVRRSLCRNPNPSVARRGYRTSWSKIRLLQPGFSIESLELGPDGSLWAAGFAAARGIVIRQSSNGEQQLLTVPFAATIDETRESYLPVALGLTGHNDVWLLAKHPDCSLISGKCRYGIFHLGSTVAHEPRPTRIQPVCKKEAEPDEPLVAPTTSCASVFVRLSGPRLSDPADKYLAIRRVLRGHPEFAKATFGTFHPSGGAWFGAGGLSYNTNAAQGSVR